MGEISINIYIFFQIKDVFSSTLLEANKIGILLLVCVLKWCVDGLLCILSQVSVWLLRNQRKTRRVTLFLLSQKKKKLW